MHTYDTLRRRAEIAALRFLRDQMDNDIAEGYVTVAMRDPQPPPAAAGTSRRRRGALHDHEPPPPEDADPGPPIIAFLAVTPDQIVHLAVPDLDSNPGAAHKLATALFRTNSAASIGSAATRGASRRWGSVSVSGNLDDALTRTGESGHWGRGALRALRSNSNTTAFDSTAESRVLRRSAAATDLPPGVEWVLAALDVSLCPWWRTVFSSRGRGDTSGSVWRKMSLGAARSASRGLRGVTTRTMSTYRSASQPVTPGAAAVNSWFGDAADHRLMRLSRPASAAVSRAASFDSNSSGSVPSLPRPWSGDPTCVRPRPASAPAVADAPGGHIMWPGPVGVAAVSGATGAGASRGGGGAEEVESAPAVEMSTVASSGLPMPPTAALEDAGRFGVYVPPELETSPAPPRGASMFGGFGPIMRAGSSGTGSLSRSRQQSTHAFHALDAVIDEEGDDPSGSSMTM